MWCGRMCGERGGEWCSLYVKLDSLEDQDADICTVWVFSVSPELNLFF